MVEGCDLAAEEGKKVVPTCRGCMHYYITHDPQYPYGCRAFGFTTRRPPVLEVAAASATQCLFFCEGVARSRRRMG